MRVFRDDVEYQGTPEEIAQLFTLTLNRIEAGYLPEYVHPDDFNNDEDEVLKNTVQSSVDLRRELDKNPEYNPFGGVVPSKEVDNVQTPAPANESLGLGNQDTGVTLNG